MAYQVLYRKYRPQKFSDLTGQETTVKILQSALTQNRIASAYLFSGPRGTGKTTTARIFAKTLNCKNRTESWVMSLESRKLATHDSLPMTDFPEPCNECVSCQEILQGSSLDVLELDAASHTQVEKIREVIIDTVAFAPVRDPYKIFIIDEVHMLSNHSFNALLKTLEEPPPHVVFMLCTTEFHKIPATIASRCQRYRFMPMTQTELTGALAEIAEKENLYITQEALGLIARAASGSVRDALSLLDQVISNFMRQGETKNKKIELGLVQETLGTVREELIREFVLKIIHNDTKGVLNCIEEVSLQGIDLSYFLKELRESFRQMLIAKCGAHQESSAKKLPVEQMNLHQILRSIQLLNKCADQMRWSDFPRLVFECYAVWLCRPTVDVEAVLKKIEKERAIDSNPIGKEGTNNFSTDKASNINSISSDEERKESSVSAHLPKREFVNPMRSAPQWMTADMTETMPTNGLQMKTDSAVSSQLTSSVKLESNVDIETWKAVLNSIQQSKPSLFHPLQSARIFFSDEKVQLSFSKSFWLENVKRNKILLEETFAKVLNRRLPIELALSKDPETATETKSELFVESPALEETLSESPSLPLSTATEDPAKDANSFEEELFEVVESEEKTKSVSQKSVEDEGLKTLLHFFPGELTPLPPKSSG